ncbi:MAG: ATP-dependent RNA helicase HrpA [Kineosporiaceae bacterium]|nr:ATP-dependent RNA helicase HrpA [Aeromicrobium sp.]
MKLHYHDALPISARRQDIAEAITNHQVVVVAGETGSGKTTQLPKIAFGLGRTRIAHTQPRRIAARAVAQRIADECEVSLGAEVGYAVRFDDKTSSSTAIKLMTDGLLLAEINRDRNLSRYDTIIIDEAHERSLAIDFLLGYLKTLLPRRPDLKVIITSATIDVDRFAAMFDAPVIEVSGRTFPVEVRYRPLAERDDGDYLSAIDDAVRELPNQGDILVFLSGEREIRDATEYLNGRKYRLTEVLPLYGRLSTHDQQKIFSNHSGRRIVLATNVAETSLTVPGIRYVIDPGLARISRFSQRLKVQRLPIEAISQASANQRAGRCGRVADGICIRLYAEDDFDSRPEFTDPEILRTNLASVLLQMASLDLGDIRRFPFLDPPDSRAIADGTNLLRELGALRGNNLSKLGRTLSGLPVDPRLGRMLLAADRLGCLADVLVIVSAMSIQDPRERPLDHQQAADLSHKRFVQPDSDFLSFLTLWTYLREKREELSHSKFRKMCKGEYLHYVRIREWHDVHSQLRQTAKDLKMRPGHTGADPDLIHQAMLEGLLSHIGLKDTDGREYVGARNSKFMVFPGSGLAKKPPRWIMAGELVETTRLWARTNAKIQPEWIEKAAAHLVKRSYNEPHWSTRRSAVMAKEKVTLYGLPIVVDRLVTYSAIDPVVARDLFIRHALVQGEWKTNHRFFAHNRALLEEVDEIEDRVRRRDIRVDDETLYAFYDARLGTEAVSGRHFDTWWKQARRDNPELLTFTSEDLLRADAPGGIDSEFPHEWHSETAAYPLTYAFEPGTVHDGVTVDVPLTDLTTIDAADFAWSVPGHREELIAGLIRSLPKNLRRNFVPAPEFARKLLDRMDAVAGDVSAELATQMRMLNGTLVKPSDFDWTSLPDHLRIRFRILDGDKELATGKDLDALREQLTPQLRKGLRQVAKKRERSGMTSWDVGTIDKSIAVGQATGYPALVDEGAAVALRMLDSLVEQKVAMIRGQARLLVLTSPTPVVNIAKNLDLKSKLTLSTGPYADGASLIDDCYLAALDELVVRHGGPVWDEASFAGLREKVRQEAYGVTEATVQSAIKTLKALGEVTLDRSEAGEDVRVQLSWLIYRGFIRDAGVANMRRIPLYLEAARRRLSMPTTADVLAVQDLEALFHERTAPLNDLERLEPRVQHARWALEELRLSFFAQGLKTAFPVSTKRVTTLVEGL